jgi:uncharacterized protein
MEKSQLFILDGVSVSVIQSGYTVRKAEVVGVDAVILPVNSPWSFLDKKKN